MRRTIKSLSIQDHSFSYLISGDSESQKAHAFMLQTFSYFDNYMLKKEKIKCKCVLLENVDIASRIRIIDFFSSNRGTIRDSSNIMSSEYIKYKIILKEYLYFQS